MAGPEVTLTPSPTGGCVLINITLGDPALMLVPTVYTTPITIQRYTGSLANPPTIILNNSTYTPVYLDAGDSLPNYLDFGTSYWYSVTDPTGTTVVGPIVPAPQLAVFSNYLDGLLFRLFSAGCSAIAVPANFNPIRVLQAMPLTPASDGTIFPFVVMNLDLEQQEETQIGENVLFSPNNINIIPLIIQRTYSINILSHNAQERDFYKDAMKGVIYTMMTALDQAGQGFSYRYQASNTQSGTDLNMPGFYASITMLEFTGQSNMTITTTLPPISQIDVDVTTYTGTVSGIPTEFQIVIT
jgi:hypothetical protein